jgi:Do/DeqQ family serine protease
MGQRLRIATAIAVALVAGLSVPRGLLALQPASPIAQAEAAPDGLRTGAPAASEQGTAAPESRDAIRLSFAPVVKRVAPAVVNVYATSRVEVRSPFEGDPFFERFFGPRGMPFEPPRERARSSLGSGVIVGADGVVVTNNHVIAGATEVKVALTDGREFESSILLRDEGTDLAVLRIDNGDATYPVLDFADSDALEVGDLVLAVGNPFGVGQTVTSGIVSAVARTNLGINDSGFFIQTDAAINPGNSGGALVDVDGRLAGINTAIFSRSGGSIGIGFAIPSNMVKAVVAQAVAGSTSVVRPWIGAELQDVTQDIAASLGVAAPQGALVTEVTPESPAEAAGLKPGDLILGVAGLSVPNKTGLDYRLAVAGVGKALALQVWRDGVTLALSITPQAEPELAEDDLTLLKGRSPLSGAVVADLSPALADRLDVRGAERGAIIVDVDPRSPAARMGFRPGDVVMRVQGREITGAGELAEVVEAGARLWRISFNRNGRVSNVVVGG